MQEDGSKFDLSILAEQKNNEAESQYDHDDANDNVPGAPIKGQELQRLNYQQNSSYQQNNST